MAPSARCAACNNAISPGQGPVLEFSVLCCNIICAESGRTDRGAQSGVMNNMRIIMLGQTRFRYLTKYVYNEIENQLGDIFVHHPM